MAEASADNEAAAIMENFQCSLRWAKELQGHLESIREKCEKFQSLLNSYHSKENDFQVLGDR